MTRTECVECGATIELDGDVMRGEILPCRDCGVELEVLSLEPMEIGVAPPVEEDWGE